MKPRHNRIEHWDDERTIGNSLIVTLKVGWKFSEDPMLCEHVMGFDTVKEAMVGVRKSMVCNCLQCLND